MSIDSPPRGPYKPNAPGKMTRQESGRLGGLAKAGGQRIVRLEGLTPEERAIVLAYAELGRKRLERATPPDPEAA